MIDTLDFVSVSAGRTLDLPIDINQLAHLVQVIQTHLEFRPLNSSNLEYIVYPDSY
jgi:hypothetical protein